GFGVDGAVPPEEQLLHSRGASSAGRRVRGPAGYLFASSWHILARHRLVRVAAQPAPPALELSARRSTASDRAGLAPGQGAFHVRPRRNSHLSAIQHHDAGLRSLFPAADSLVAANGTRLEPKTRSAYSPSDPLASLANARRLSSAQPHPRFSFLSDARSRP